MSRVDISVIVPIYNVEKYIERCLRSLFTQSKTDGVEFLFINDATLDGSMAVVHQLAEEFQNLNIKIIENERNLGTSATRQRAIAAASGEYSLQIDSDDWVEPTMLEELWAEVQRSSADIVIFNYIEEYGGGRSKSRTFGSLPINGRDCLPALLTGDMMGTVWSKLIRHDLYRQANIKDIEALNMCEDLLICTHLFLYARRITQLNRPFYHYNRTNASSITSSDALRKIADISKVNLEIESTLRNGGALDAALRNTLDVRELSLCRLKIISCIDDPALRAKIISQHRDILSRIWSVAGLNFKYKLTLWAAYRGLHWLENRLLSNARKRLR